MKVTRIAIRVCTLGIGKGSGKNGNKRTSRDHPKYSIIKINPNTEKSHEVLKRLTVTQTPERNQ